MNRFTPEDLRDRFRYHPPKDDMTANAHLLVRTACSEAANALGAVMPPSREASLAITKLEEAMFWANAAIARNEL